MSTILIVDDSEMNRSILADMLEEEYSILEAEDGEQAVAVLREHHDHIALVLLDIVMPRLDGFGVLDAMVCNGWIEDLPVIMISSENTAAQVARAYDMGVTDFIGRPFDALVVRRRVVNTLLLYAKQKRLAAMVEEQIRENERQSDLMIQILSHIVEFRNGESGLHIKNVRALTNFFLQALVCKTDRYNMTGEDINCISVASALHDIGKIAIDEKILNKPGRLTAEEFAVMKTHAMKGAEMLDGLAEEQNDQMVREAYAICRWHHERWDGRGYPDGLRGDEIPIAAQVVALADVYDALTSPRVYKASIPHEKAIQMITDGECGAFNPLLLECLADNADNIRRELAAGGQKNAFWTSQNIVKDTVRPVATAAAASERTLRILQERMTALEKRAERDPLTGLLNRATAVERIESRVEGRMEGHYALCIFDLDSFKSANDQWGHQFGDRVLKEVAVRLTRSVRSSDIACRAGGDEFLLFLDYNTDLEHTVDRIFHSLCGRYEDYDISVTMGVARSEIVGLGYEDMFRAADSALYAAKRAGKSQYCFYDRSMQYILSSISDIDEQNGGTEP